ncbi:MAG: VCBS repeat-containing protein [Ignavibacteriales bacterium]|nr:VCBS repeat-containing protein [Ignavibacteriales bacterium]
MKLSKEERTALKTGISKFKILLLFVLLSEIISPQIPFKGFCKLNSFSVDSGFTKLFSFNYNQDEHSDLLLYNPTQKVAALYDGKSGTKFNLKEMLLLPVEISSIEPIISPNKIIESFVFTSRKNRSLGIYNFRSDGKPVLVSQIKLDSYPENISITNNYLDSSQSFILSGNLFDGLSIISNENNLLTEKKICSNRLFQNAQFIDLNSDGYDDIAALNSIENKLHFFYNNSRNDFNELRSININEDVLSMKVFDINYDQYKDIIVSTKSNIRIYFGDAIASFNKLIFVQTKYPADKFIIGDFNRDGFFDVNYLNVDEGIISTIFAKDFFMFYPEIIQKKKKGIVDVIPFFSKFVYGAAYINQSGEVNILSSIALMSDNQQLAVGVEPNLITSFDHINNGIVDFAFVDEFDDKLKCVIRSASGLPEKLYSVNLFEEHNKLLTFSNSKSVKTFFLYSTDKKNVEAIEIDFEKYTFKRKFHYTEGPIQDLAMKTDAGGEAELFILYSKNKILNLQAISKAPVNYSQKLYTILSSNWSNPFLFFQDKLTIGYWQIDADYTKLELLNFTEKERKPITKLKINGNNYGLVSKSNKVQTKDGFNYSVLLSSEEKYFIVAGVYEPKNFSTINTNKGFRIQDKNQLFFGKTNSIFVYDSNLSLVTEYISAKTSNKLFTAGKVENIKLSDCIIEKLDQRKYHLIFTNTKSGNIEIRQLSK